MADHYSHDIDLLGSFFATFLDEVAFKEFNAIQRLLDSLVSGGSTPSGYPRIRPSDFARVTKSLETIFETCQSELGTNDPQITARFEQLINTLYEFCHKIYPAEAINILILQCNVLLFIGRADEVIERCEHLALRPYAVIDSLNNCLKIVELFGQAHLMRGTIATVPMSFAAFGGWMVSCSNGLWAAIVGPRLAPFVVAQPAEAGFRARAIRYFSAVSLRGRRPPGAVIEFVQRISLRAVSRTILPFLYLMLKRPPLQSSPFGFHMQKSGRALVTRAMGGIGDLLMMAPGFEALAKETSQPVDVAIPRKFFPVFANNPHVRLLDIDGPQIDISSYQYFANLSLCPAARYESGARPEVKQGRVEIFASAMGVSQEQLAQQGWRINYFASDDEQAACDAFIAKHKLGNRPIVGVQPYSRDSYKDYPSIRQLILTLADTYDIVVFHHIGNGLPEGSGICSTAGLPLGTSLALVGRVRAMVSVDSAFLHAAAAHDVPVVALFGPTDARTFTRHHRQVEIVWMKDQLACVPCWRNEDLPCRLTNLRGSSPCMAGIDANQVVTAVRRLVDATS